MKMRLSAAAIERIRDHIEAAWGTAETKEDRQIATDLQTLLNIYRELIKKDAPQ